MQDQNQPNPPTGGPITQLPDTTPKPDANQAQSAAINKEGEFIALPVEQAGPAIEVPEIIESQHPEVVIPHELKSVIEQSADAKELNIPKEVIEQAVSIKESVPEEVTTPTGTMRFPMTYAQARHMENETKITDSSHWLAAFMIYLWRKYDPDAVSEAKKSLK